MFTEFLHFPPQIWIYVVVSAVFVCVRCRCFPFELFIYIIQNKCDTFVGLYSDEGIDVCRLIRGWDFRGICSRDAVEE